VSIRLRFVSVRLILSILSVTIWTFPATAQYMPPFGRGISNGAPTGAMTGKGASVEPFGCTDSVISASSDCRRGAEESDSNASVVPSQPKVPAGTVSADELRHPLSGKALRLIKKASSLIQAGDHVHAIEQLREAVKIPAAAPYAYSLLGQEHLRLGQPEAALPELEEAVRLLPSDVADAADLGLVLLMTGDAPRAEQELRHALQLDPYNLQTKLVLGETILENGSHDEEGIEYVCAAAAQFRGAHAVLAAYYAHAGQQDAAEREARSFLGANFDPSAVRSWIELKSRQKLGFSFLSKGMQ
jgi:tetratricopeptide (TPR) repeat protein